MAKITFMGAGSTVFVRNVLGDCMCREALKDSHFALYDIDGQRLKESEFILKTLNANINDNRATITSHLGVENRKEALRGADAVDGAREGMHALQQQYAATMSALREAAE